LTEQDLWLNAMQLWKLQATRKYLEQTPQSSRTHHSIYQDMRENICKAFNGFGHQTINDFLALNAIHPGTPSGFICTERELYSKLIKQIPEYFQRFKEKKYLQNTAPQCQHNPFAFNLEAHRKSMQDVFVFKRISVPVHFPLLKQYIKQGAFCPSHVLGVF